ncbi:MAG: phenylacetic acid degradation protein PaaN [Candidatus Eremiobacteraeota bacterium]|nr:phenylacetic acid degradation protein PaaN [Candidatus Eremiobacteraeota bacterium]
MTTTTAPPPAGSAAAAWFDQHQPLLDRALATIRTREYWSAYPESPSPKNYGENAQAQGKTALEARLGTRFELAQPGTVGWIGAERSPFGVAIGVTYPQIDQDALLAAVTRAQRDWAAATPKYRAGVAMEMLARINKASFEIAFATMYTTGQAFMMAFQAAGPHAQDRGLEALAYAYDAMSDVPSFALWEKPQKNEPLRVEKRYRIVPRGIGLVIASSTFPTWNSYPAMFADLVTGNAVVVKPHPNSILPLAITVEIMRGVLAEAGFDPNVVALAADTPESPIAKQLATRPEVGLVDYTGSSSFGTWLEQNAKQAQVFTEKAGVNAVVIDSTDDLPGLAKNLAMSLSLYSGQMCTTPQNVFVPRAGIKTADGDASFDDVLGAISKAVEGLLSAPERAVEILGAIATDATLERVKAESAKPGVVLASKTLAHPQFPGARVHTPLIARLDASDEERYGGEMFGPIAFVIATDSTEQSLELAARGARSCGAITAVLYSADPAVIVRAEDFAADAGVSLAVNLTGALLVNQSAAFSDFHVTGANPAGNASLTDAAFVANRFRITQTRTVVPGTASAG